MLQTRLIAQSFMADTWFIIKIMLDIDTKKIILFEEVSQSSTLFYDPWILVVKGIFIKIQLIEIATPKNIQCSVRCTVIYISQKGELTKMFII